MFIYTSHSSICASNNNTHQTPNFMERAACRQCRFPNPTPEGWICDCGTSNYENRENCRRCEKPRGTSVASQDASASAFG